jgi:hypothetical protein
MNIVERYKKPTPIFFKTLRNIGIALATTGGVVLASPVALPAVLTSIASYLTVAGTVAVSVSQAVVEDVDKEKSGKEKTLKENDGP